MSYSVAGGKTYNLVVTVPEQRDPKEWTKEECFSVKKMQSYFKDWDPTLVHQLPTLRLSINTGI